MSFELLQTLCKTPGIPGREHQFRDYVSGILGPISDEPLRTDPMGNLYSGKTLDDRVGVYVMLEAFRRFKQSADHILSLIHI